ncbi:hypothetical protein OP10G_3539 [Fimbriimonas ginsengisoli Gsoil 348]|uniref:Uncharacterized protein n=1 Tax=Fimbriimonas ginsengisoli Gsoil 348 TaxID=661478 RepID=A0A068NU62_FIMGI|nr:hypothetical protein OP10G_3539 [Fimbriimonas ginsengisoli Gsoil 348]
MSRDAHERRCQPFRAMSSLVSTEIATLLDHPILPSRPFQESPQFSLFGEN